MMCIVSWFYRIVIVNEELFITNASQDQIDQAFNPQPSAAVGSSPAIPPSVPVGGILPTSPVPGPSAALSSPVQSPAVDPAIRVKMVEQFSLQSEMNAVWSER